MNSLNTTVDDSKLLNISNNITPIRTREKTPDMLRSASAVQLKPSSKKPQLTPRISNLGSELEQLIRDQRTSSQKPMERPVTLGRQLGESVPTFTMNSEEKHVEKELREKQINTANLVN